VLQRQVVASWHFQGYSISRGTAFLGFQRLRWDPSSFFSPAVTPGYIVANEATRRGSSHSIAAVSVIGRPWK
jgi:hypothetical protein